VRERGQPRSHPLPFGLGTLLCFALPLHSVSGPPTKRESQPASVCRSDSPTTLPPSKQTSLHHHHHPTHLTIPPPDTSHCITAVALLASPHHPSPTRLLTRASGLTSASPSPSASPTRRSAHSQGHRLCARPPLSKTQSTLTIGTRDLTRPISERDTIACFSANKRQHLRRR
jgi:hypothetical protein